eukprot:15465204-Alexandrium_andersonii.AAC.1
MGCCSVGPCRRASQLRPKRSEPGDEPPEPPRVPNAPTAPIATERPKRPERPTRCERLKLPEHLELSKRCQS